MIRLHCKAIGYPFTSINSIPRLFLHQLDPNSNKPYFYKPKFSLTRIKFRYSSLQLYYSGEKMFAICAEYPVMEDFVKHLNLTDSFQTWFSITSLHVWLCLVRLRQEGREGHILKRRLLSILNTDLDRRLRSFRVLTGRYLQRMEFRTQLLGSTFAYDEGLLSHSDSLLATAIWRNLFVSSKSTNPKELELAIHYIRKQLAHLDTISAEKILSTGMITFLPFIGDELNNKFAMERTHYCVSWPEH